MELSEEGVLGHYLTAFDERTRAAHTAALLLARAAEPSRWPTVPLVRKCARLFEVSMAELGAFFGLMCRIERGKELWVDVFRDGPGAKDAKQLMTREQKRAYGMMLTLTDLG